MPAQELCQALVPPLNPPQELRALPQGSAPSLSGKDWGSFGFDLSFSPLWHHPELCFPAGEQEGQPPPPPQTSPHLDPAVLFQMDLLLMRCSVPSKLLSGSSGLPSVRRAVSMTALMAAD